jgi:hypothetical protein
LLGIQLGTGAGPRGSGGGSKGRTLEAARGDVTNEGLVAEDAALKRHRVARLALRLPQVLEELRAGTIHLTGLFLLSTHLTEQNAGVLLADARGKSRRQIEELIALRFPRPDVPPRVEPVVPRLRLPRSSSSRACPARNPDTPPRARGAKLPGSEQATRAAQTGSSHSRPIATAWSSRPAPSSETSSNARASS